jgi:hypothetical protein
MKLKLALPLLVLLAGCASLGMPTPKSYTERLASGYSSVASVRTSATILLNGGVIGSSDAENIQKQADVAREGLDVARSLTGAAAETKLDATLLALQAAQNYLCAKSPTDPNCQR